MKIEEMRLMSFKALKISFKENLNVKEYLGKLINLDENDEEQCKFADKILRINKLPVNDLFEFFNFYKNPEITNLSEWLPCPKCGHKPKIWIYNNGVNASCCCASSRYDRFTIRIEDINSIVRRTGSPKDYKGEQGLMEEWNRYCRGEFERTKKQ